ncbi:MAG: hypothetical protein AAGA30_18445 [Planctomycetota bacterium]
MSFDCEQIRDIVRGEFLAVERPSNLLSSYRPKTKKLLKQWESFENIDWDNLTDDSFLGIYEPNTFVSPEAYAYLFPRVFSFVCDKGEKAFVHDFVKVFFELPIVAAKQNYFDFFSLGQRHVAIKAFDCLVQALGYKEFFDWTDSRAVIHRLLFE